MSVRRNQGRTFAEVPPNGKTYTKACYVILPLHATQPVVVTLTTSDPTEVSLPSNSVTIPVGKNKQKFSIKIEDDDIKDGNQIATITASANGYAPGSTLLKVIDDE